MNIKRIVAAAFVSALTVVGVAPAAQAAPAKKVDRPAYVKVVKAPGTGGGGPVVIQRAIDWD